MKFPPQGIRYSTSRFPQGASGSVVLGPTNINFWPYSNDPTKWQPDNADLIAAAGLAPDGVSMTAWRFKNNTDVGSFPRGAMRRPQGYPRFLERGISSFFIKRESGSGIICLLVYDGTDTTASYVNVVTNTVSSQHADHHVVTAVASTNGYCRVSIRYKPMRSMNTLPNLQLRLTDTVGNPVYGGATAESYLIWGAQWEPNQANASAEVQVNVTLLDTDDVIIVGDGNGMMEGPTGLTDADHAIPYVLAGLLDDLNASAVMYAVSGGDTALMVDDVATQANAMKTTGGATVILLFSHYHTDVLVDFEAYAAVLDATFKIIVISCLVEYTFDAPTIAAVTAMNASLDASTAFDGYLDINSDSRFAHNNTTYRQDGVYPTDAGALLIAQLLEPIVRGLL